MSDYIEHWALKICNNCKTMENLNALLDSWRVSSRTVSILRFLVVPPVMRLITNRNGMFGTAESLRDQRILEIHLCTGVCCINI